MLLLPLQLRLLLQLLPVSPAYVWGSCTGLTDGVGGGVWSSSNTAVATIDATGLMCGVSAGTSIITYAIGSCRVTTAIRVYANPTPISGPSAVCVGSTMTLTDGIAGGVWSSSNVPVASIGSSTGVVTGVSLGTAIISYTLPGGCITTKSITVSPTPTAITGPSTVCTGTCVLFADAVPGGLWTSSNPGVATAGSTSGDICGVSAGTAVITYSLGSGCTAYKTVTVIPSPSAISGASTVCVGSTTVYTDPTAGGAWTSGNTAVATVSSTGTVGGASAGTAVISYTMPSGCYAVKTITVTPVPAAITGTTTMCVGSCTTLADAVPGGTWSSSATSVATVNTTGGVCGASAGTAVITYSLGGCFATIVVTVTPLPSVIGGGTSLGVGSSMTLTNTVSGGVWTSSNTSFVTIGSASGIATGVGIGCAEITYTLPTGCFRTHTICVSTWCGSCPIAGPSTLCTGTCSTYSFPVTGGTWSSTAPSVATIDPTTGFACGVSAGSTVITYTTGSCCYVTKTITVSPSAAAISGVSSICVGQNTLYTNSVSGGAWSSSTTSVATVNATGTVYGVGSGTSTISYMLPGGCYATKVITVNLTPGAIVGLSTICANKTTTYTNSVSGGVWTSSNPSVGTISSSLGDFYPNPVAVTTGTTIITYALGSCIATKTVVVNPIAPITGSTNVCVGTCTTLSDVVPGGVWSTSSSAIASVSSGVVCGVATGTVIISYVMPSGCFETTTVTVNALPAPITGPSDVCVGSCISLGTITTGGAWTSSSPAIASIDALGNMCGVSAGTARITYSIGSGCYVTRVFTVDPLPGAISGASNICIGSSTTVSASPSGGTWSSSNISVASITSAGPVLYGISAGTSVITYMLPTGCYRTTVVTVNPLPAAISGMPQVCVGSCTALSDATGGGTWSITSTAIGTISSTGTACGVSVGTTVITYTLATGCIATVNFSVTPSPSVISGPSHICQNTTSLFTNLVPGGVWSSSNSSVASINSATGAVTGNSSGTVIIAYVLGTGCMTVTALIVDPVVPITGPTTVCVGQNIVLIDTALGGAWSTSLPAIATAASGAGGLGIITGVAPGAVTVTYTLPTGCITTYRVSVNPVPPAITGPSNVCQGQSITLGNTRLGGTWSSSIATTAAITAVTPTPASATVFGTAAGTSTISYTIAGCAAMLTVTVNPLPLPITGSPQVCVFGTTSLADAVPGGTWFSSASAIATADLTTGVVTGMSPGTANITYTIGTGCYTTIVVTVNPNPVAITGVTTLCVNGTTTLSDATPGGSWNSLNMSVATTDASGIITGVSAGTATIIYGLATGCYASVVVRVYPLPPAITGPYEVCEGSTITLADAAPGGAWSSLTPAIATAGTSSGIVTGVAAGVATIVYTLSTGCNVSTFIFVNPIPAPITGSLITCVGSNTTLSDATAGGD